MKILARQLPDSGTYPRYVVAGQAITDCELDSRGKAVRLTVRCWISTSRWNEIAQSASSLGDAMQIALSESHAARSRGKSEYAAVCAALDAIDHPGYQSRRTALAIHAAALAKEREG